MDSQWRNLRRKGSCLNSRRGYNGRGYRLTAWPKEFQRIDLGLLNNPLFVSFLLPFCTCCAADMSPKVIGDADFSKLNKCVALQTEDTAVWTDNRVRDLLMPLVSYLNIIGWKYHLLLFQFH